MLQALTAEQTPPELAHLLVAAYMLMLPVTTPHINYCFQALRGYLPQLGGPQEFLEACRKLVAENISPRLAQKVSPVLRRTSTAMTSSAGCTVHVTASIVTLCVYQSYLFLSFSVLSVAMAFMPSSFHRTLGTTS